MPRDHSRQFPPLSALDWPDPALVDRPIGECEPQPSPSWSTIAMFWTAGLALIAALWGGMIF